MEDNLIKCDNVIQLFKMSENIEIVMKQIYSIFNYEILRLGFYNERIQRYEKGVSNESKVDLYSQIRNIQIELYIQILKELKKQNVFIAYEKFKEMIYVSKERTYFSINEIVMLNDLATQFIECFNQIRTGR